MTTGAAPAPVADRQPLYFHVGLPKSGSTYLQDVLAGNRRVLREHGYVYPFVRPEGMFHAAVEMVGSAERWGLDPALVTGTFARLLARGRRLGGTVVLSHEIFGRAEPDQIRQMGELLADFEVHLVVTTRDLARTVVASWQEGVKNGNARSFAEFEAALGDLAAGPRDSGSFWGGQNLVAILERWRLLVPPQRIHVVTCPRRGAPSDLLWRRFADAIGLDPAVVDLDQVPVRNESLGAAEIALLRGVLDAVGDRLPQPWHARLAKRWLAQTLLREGASPKPVAPAPLVEGLTAVAQDWVASIEAAGYRVHGDLAELVPDPPAADARHPDQVTVAESAALLPEVIAEMLVRVRELGEEVEELGARLEAAERERDARREQVTALEEQGRQRLTARLRRLLRRR